MKKLLLAGLLLEACGAAPAQTAPADTTQAAPKPLATYGVVDAYHGFDFNQANISTRPYFLCAHNRQNEFAVSNAVLGMRYDDGSG